MNLRYLILRAAADNPGATNAEICDVIDYDRQKVQYSVRECSKAGLLSMRRDDVTGQPGYTLTDAGKKRLSEGPESQNKIGKPKSTSSTNVQPAVTHNTGSSASDQLSTPAEGAAVQPEPAPESPADVSTAAPVAEDDRAWIDLGMATAQLTDELESAKAARDIYLEARDEMRRELDQIRALLAGRVRGPLDPSDLSDLSEVEMAQKAAELLDEAADEISRAISAERKKDDELLHQASLVISLSAQLANQTALVEKLEHLLQSARNEAEHLRKHAVPHADAGADMVNSPPHYTQGGIECIDAIKAALTPKEFRGYLKGNVIKYVWREIHKGGKQSLAKAQWYLTRATDHTDATL